MLITRKLAQVGLVGAVMALVGCEFGLPRLPASFSRTEISPALSVLALDFERTSFARGALVSGDVAQAQRSTRVATASDGRIRNEATGPIPTEVKVELSSLITSGNTVSMSGKLVLRDLSFGTVLAELDNFEAEGSFPATPLSGKIGGVVFRGVEDEILEWIGTLSCDTRARVCGEDLVPSDATAVASIENVEPGADLALETFVDNRPGGSLTKLVGGAIDPGQVIAASTPVETSAGAAASASLGTTVAALGLLGRSGFWLQTPLVSEESPGEVLDPATGRRLPVTLIPKDGPAGGGSQISLAALNELGFDATALVTLEVFR